MTTDVRESTAQRRGPSGLPRLLAGPRGGEDLPAHRARYGPVPLPARGRSGRRQLLDAVARSGLLGRGGAGFAAARKLTALASAKRPVVVVNASEGEPASDKDAVLLAHSPHLVLDGAVVAAYLIGADDIVVCLPHRRVGRQHWGA